MDNQETRQMIELHDNTIIFMRELFGLGKSGDMDKLLDLFEDWMKKQAHFLKKDFTRSYLEAIIITCKGSLERAKISLDKRCTYKTLMPHFFGNFDIRHELKDFDGKVRFNVASKLNENHERVCIVRYTGKEPSPTCSISGWRIAIMIMEYLYWYTDYANGYIIIFDILDASLKGILSKFNPRIELHRANIIGTKLYAGRIKGLHVLTQSKLVEFVFNIGKRINEKISRRVKFHQSRESLSEYFPNYLLPKDYGGTDKALDELYAEWIEALSGKEFLEFLSDVSAGGTDESLRDTTVYDDIYMWTHGTFRTLDID